MYTTADVLNAPRSFLSLDDIIQWQQQFVCPLYCNYVHGQVDDVFTSVTPYMSSNFLASCLNVQRFSG